MNKTQGFQLGLALSGGAARGYAHIGVLKVLEEAGVPISHVAGTSVGAVIGALFCGGYGWAEIWELGQHIKWRSVVEPVLPRMGLVRTEPMAELLDELLKERTFEELSIPFQVIAVDLEAAEEVVFSTGSVARAVQASASVPGIFEPQERKERLLVDGGVINNLPSLRVREMGADKVIAVDLNADRTDPHRPQSLLDVTYRTFSILMWNASRAGRRDADVLIEPALSAYRYHDLSAAEELFDLGVLAAREALPEIRALMTV